jgi:opacity protein-like surface antigen
MLESLFLSETSVKLTPITLLFLLASSATTAATPIDGWYSSVFGGYAYLPNNLATSRNSIAYSNASYESEYNAGGSFGFKSNPMRYEAQVTYVNAMLDNVFENGQYDSLVAGYNNAIFGLANVYYDFPTVIPTITPFLGVGLGYGWINVKVDNMRLPNTPDFNVSDSAFAYQGSIGVTFNFSENYALDIGYRYLATSKVFDLGKTFQAHLANVSAIYRYDEAHYK